MELVNTYENVKELVECQSGKAGGNRESLKPERHVQPMELDRRNLSLRVTYVLLGVCILLSVVAIVTVVMLSRLRCPTGWIRFRESCYHFSSSTETWVEAQRQCASLDGHLVVINNAEEREYILLNMNRDYWIGLNDIVQEGMWHWVDGTDYASNVKFWESSQPNGREEFDEDCAVVSGSALWHDWPCDSKHLAICEKRAT